jgi:hypothetical protein
VSHTTPEAETGLEEPLAASRRELQRSKANSRGHVGESRSQRGPLLFSVIRCSGSSVRSRAFTKQFNSRRCIKRHHNHIINRHLNHSITSPRQSHTSNSFRQDLDKHLYGQTNK